MTKASANPRRYSRGTDGLDENQALKVYLALFAQSGDLEATYGRLDYLADKHEEAVVNIVGYGREHGETMLTLEVDMGPARAALRGQSRQVQAGYAFLWDVAKTLFYANPVFVGPPGDDDVSIANTNGESKPVGTRRKNAVQAS
jgi:hypothetical protein